MTYTDIAIVGLACRFAGDARSPEAFHEMLVKARDAWTEVPSSRYTAKSFQHLSRDRRGTTVHNGGYFLQQDLSKWDAPFFSCSAAEANAFDPQQRLLLEVSYECLENAGLPLESVSGTDTACFIGSFTNDYKKILSRDIHATAQYAATGSSRNMLSNRISWFYNLNGSSMTIDTACSSSMTALHLACESIHSSSSKTRTAFVGGSNLVMDPDDPCSLNALGFLSPESRCFAFDSRASGYSRGEGVGMVFLKHIDDAIRDGDPIRAVIRGTGINSDGRTAGITLPNGDAQRQLILDTYKSAGLQLGDTQYVELHGTGTKVGDPAEVGAVTETIAAARDDPVYCGSVKTNIGHLEGAAGIAAIIKAVLALESGVIQPNRNLVEVNPNLKLDPAKIKIPIEATSWPDCEVRRCSVSNFGFGGANAHCIMDGAEGYLRRRGITYDGSSSPTMTADLPPRLFVLSAPQKDAIARQREAHASYAEGHSANLSNLARTLCKHRSTFPWRHAVVAKSNDELVTHWRDNTIKSAKADTSPGVAFVFTGQGAQWYAMGRELAAYSTFAISLRDSAALLTGLGCKWDAWDELMASEEHSSKVGLAEYSQPLCVVLQIALVDLLATWGIRPSAVVGHSSGEISAAYAAGALSREDCLKVAFQRGLVSNLAKERSPNGSMMAIGLPEHKVKPYLSDSIVLACVNSPTSVTLAGNKSALQDLSSTLKGDNIFCRLLQVENAFHSPQMLSVRDEYLDSLGTLSPKEASVPFYSSVYCTEVPATKLDADYWVQNMCSPVQFVGAMDAMVYVDVPNGRLRSKAPSLLLEVGPHAALKGPIKQFLDSRDGLKHLSYLSMLYRGQDAALTAVGAAGSLWMNGVPADVNQVNNPTETFEVTSILKNLPPYPWDHSNSYWHESRSSKNHRFPVFPHHDLIGSLIDDYNPREPTWKNCLRLSDLPWLQDHQIHGDIVFPAAGMISSAIEAARQHYQLEGRGGILTEFELREIVIAQALVVPNDEAGVDIYLHLKPHKLGSGTGSWLDFSLYSVQERDTFVEHASGQVQAQYLKEVNEVDGGRERNEEIRSYQLRYDGKRSSCTETMTSSSHYDFCSSLGIVYGQTFQGLKSISQNALTTAFEIQIPETSVSMPLSCESSYVIHPATLDTVLQVTLTSVSQLRGIQKQAWVPTSIETITISTEMTREAKATVYGISEASLLGPRGMASSCFVGDGKFNTMPSLVIEGVQFKGLGDTDTTTPGGTNDPSAKLYSTVCWKPDVDLVTGDQLRSLTGSSFGSHEMIQFSKSASEIVNNMCQVSLAKHNVNDPSLPPHLHKYVDWMRARASIMGPATPPKSPPSHSEPTDASDHGEDSDCGIPGLFDFVKKYPVDGGLLRHTFRSLQDIMTQENIPIAALMANENFSMFYKESFGLTLHAKTIQKWFDLKAHQKPSLRIIEIGAGTASTSLPVLKILAGDELPRLASYTFTDISAGWFDNAREILSSYKPRVEYKVLDISSDPLEQGFEAESYDVVLAVDVLHATKSIDETLQNCKTLLKPGGNLILGEHTNPDDMIHFIFGTLPGWWESTDGRENGPLLSPSQWDTALKNNGFSGTDKSLQEISDGESVHSAHRMSTIVSTKVGERGYTSNDVVIVTPDIPSPATDNLASSISARFNDVGTTAVVKNLSKAVQEAAGKSIVSLLDYGSPFLENLDATHFEQVKSLLLYSSEVLWVTRSDVADGPGHPTRRLISGLIRCLMMEDSTRQLYELHFSHDLLEDSGPASKAVYHRLYSIWAAESGALMEMETVDQGGMLSIPRYVPYQTMNRSLAQATADTTQAPQLGKLLQPGRPLKITIGQQGMLDTLHFVDDETASLPLGDREVEIEMQAYALNFKDIMIAMGQVERPDFSFHEAAGVVRRVGSRVTRCAVGDRVAYGAPGPMRTCSRTNEMTAHKLPLSMSVEEGVSIPISYGTAYHSLINVARLQPGETVLIHAASGGLGQALIHIAKFLKAEIFCTVGTEEKRAAIIDLGVPAANVFSSRDLSFAKGIHRVTSGRGVDIVVNSLAGEALRQSWKCLAKYGRFVEVGMKDVLGNSGLDMRPFMNNTTFSCVDFEDIILHQQHRYLKIIDEVLRFFQLGQVGHIKPISVRDIREIGSTFREMQRGIHIGKLVLRVTPESQVPIAPRRVLPLHLNANGTYLLIGGLGGLGRAQALFMAENGARHMAFISRSGDVKQEAKDTLAILAKKGVYAKAYAGDCASSLALRTILQCIRTEMPPIKGVIQGAMVLDDSLFHKMDHKQWQAATYPKVQGTWNLHQQLPQDIDFFIVLSSLAGIVGSVSQSNYAAGNTFMDALVHYRRAKGLTALSLDLGVIQGIGYVEENEDVSARMGSFGLASIKKRQFYHLFRCALAGTSDGLSPLSAQILAGAGTGGIMQESQKHNPDANLYWLSKLPHFAYLKQLDLHEAAAGDEAKEEGGSRMIAQLAQCTSMPEAHDTMLKVLLSKIASIISMSAADINTAKPVYMYGVDSLVAVELRNWLSSVLKSDLSIFDLTSNAPITDVAMKIANRSQLVPTAIKAES